MLFQNIIWSFIGICILFVCYCILMMALSIGRRDIMEIEKTGKLGKKPWWAIW